VCVCVCACVRACVLDGAYVICNCENSDTSVKPLRQVCVCVCAYLYTHVYPQAAAAARKSLAAVSADFVRLMDAEAARKNTAAAQKSHCVHLVRLLGVKDAAARQGPVKLP
jgi:hypothetical protein